MTISRRLFLGALANIVLVGTSDEAQAKRKKTKRRGKRGLNLGGTRGTSDSGDCPCNGGKICVGPRGGRYCLTSSENATASRPARAFTRERHPKKLLR